MPALLELTDVSKSFGALKVIDRLSLALAPGEALGVIGPNGAGKSTLFNLIGGALRPDAGSVRLKGRDITGVPAARRCRLGLGRSHQIPLPFAGMTVFENVLVGATFGTGRSERQCRAPAIHVLERTGLLDRANRLAGSLTLLERKRLELARALSTGPEVLLLDEIAGGLTEAECQQLVGTIGTLRSEGVALIWIEHIVHALVSVVDRLMVLDFGHKIAEGLPREVLADPRVQAVYLGIEGAAA